MHLKVEKCFICQIKKKRWKYKNLILAREPTIYDAACGSKNLHWLIFYILILTVYLLTLKYFLIYQIPIIYISWHILNQLHSLFFNDNFPHKQHLFSHFWKKIRSIKYVIRPRSIRREIGVDIVNLERLMSMSNLGKFLIWGSVHAWSPN